MATALSVAGLGAAVPFAATASASGNLPPLDVGARTSATRLSFTLADRVTATVDVGTGNLQVSSTDLTLPGIGQDLDLGLDFNSLLLGSGSPLPTGAPGAGWAMRLGADTKLLSNTDGSLVYLGPDGVEGLFTPGTPAGTYVASVGLKADLVSTSSPAGWRLSEHSSGRVLTFNSSGRLTKVADRNANPTVFAYTSGLLSQVTSTRGDATSKVATVSSNANGTISGLSQTGGTTTRTVGYGYTSGRLTSITDALGHTTSFGYDTTTGDLTSVTNNGGGVTNFVFTATHKVSRITQLNPIAGSPGDSVTRLAYPTGTTTLVAGPGTDLAQDVAVVPHTTYTLDGTDRVTTAVDADGHTRTAGYTAGFDVNSTTIGTGSTQSQSSGLFTANSGESLTQATSPSGAAASLAYNNTSPGSKYAPSGGTDSQGNASAFAYDTAGNQTSGGNTALAATAKVTYNADGTVATTTDPANGTNETNFTVNTTTHQLTSITPATGGSLGTRAFTYDTFSRLKTATSGASTTTTYGYDLGDRPTLVDYSDSTTSVTYAYDTTGRLKTRTDASGTTTYGYDALNHLISRVNTNGGGTIGYGYDKAGRQTSLTDSRGTTSYTYSPGGQLTSMTTAQGTLVRFAYDDHGRRTDTWDATVTAGTRPTSWAVHTQTTCDLSGRPSHVTADKGTGDSSHTPVADLLYCYANANTNPASCSAVTTSDRSLLQSSKDNITGAISTYHYDAGNRLKDVTITGGPAPTSYAYTYDTNGNRLTATGTTTAHYNAQNQVSDTGNTYDGAGNLTASPTLGSASYNAAGQMTAATNTGGGSGTYTYADRNQNELVAQTVPGGTTVKYTYGRTDSNGLPQIEQVSIGGTYGYIEHDPTTGQPLTIRVTDGNEAFYISDGLSRPVALVNAAGNTSTYAYDPYGITTAAGGSAVGQSPYRFAPGSIYDRTTNMLKYGQRWYQPTTGRFTQQDSITHLANPQQGNKYAYAGDDPVNVLDPLGTCSEYLNADGSPSGVCDTELNDPYGYETYEPTVTVLECDIIFGTIVGIATVPVSAFTVGGILGGLSVYAG